MLTPLKDFIILELPVNSKSKVVVPDNQDKARIVEGSALLVIKTGVECKNVKMGDRIICDFKNAMINFTFEGKQLFLTKEVNVCAVIRR